MAVLSGIFLLMAVPCLAKAPEFCGFLSFCRYFYRQAG
jgi:hypothetical protein